VLSIGPDALIALDRVYVPAAGLRHSRGPVPSRERNNGSARPQNRKCDYMLLALRKPPSFRPDSHLPTPNSKSPRLCFGPLLTLLASVDSPPRGSQKGAKAAKIGRKRAQYRAAVKPSLDAREQISDGLRPQECPPHRRSPSAQGRVARRCLIGS
jgi:hypothetical protein